MDQAAYFEQMRTKRRNEILAEARKMILKYGMSTFNIQQLARSLDISTVTLYKYFKNMNDIVFALKEACSVNLFGKFFAAVPDTNKDCGLKKIEMLMHLFYLHAIKSRDDLTLLVLFEAHTLSLPVKKADADAFSIYVEKIKKIMLELLQQAKEDGSAASDLDITDAMNFILQMNQAMLQHIGLIPQSSYRRKKEEIRVQIDQMIQLFLNYLTKE